VPTELHELPLPGCAPEPLMAYLKALGVFRLVAEQKDRHARAWWQGDSIFHLKSTLNREALLSFFLEEYRPTPIVAPWNGGSGFYPKDQREALTTIRQTDSPRFESYQGTIQQSERSVAKLGIESAPSGNSPDARALKLSLCEDLRSSLPDEALSWLDAVYVLAADHLYLPPLLGTGGNDGRLEFTNNFMQNVLLALPSSNSEPEPKRRRSRSAPQPEELLSSALFNDTQPTLTKGAIGQFNPGGVGGPNATAGFEAGSLTNPWDYVLMIEGALVFAGAVARRLSAESRSKAVFPFTVDTSAAGYGTAVDAEYTSDGSRAEVWAPLWNQAATYREITHLFCEGRAQLGKRQATTGTDFARAVVGLGIERGISSFQRFGFLKRNGLAFIATPLGRLQVKEDAASADRANLLFDLDPWLERLRDASQGRNAPESLKRSVRGIDRAILDFCAHAPSGGQGARLLQEVLIAVGRAERWLATARNLRGRPNPLQGLSPQWLEACNDNSAEFRLAASLASIQGDRTGAVGPIRENLEPVAHNRRTGSWFWADDNPSVVWRDGDPLQALDAVLERRCLDARMAGLSHTPVYGQTRAPLVDIHAFLEDRLDYQRIVDLLLPLTALDWQDPDHRFTHPPVPPTFSRAYAILKLLFLPEDFTRHQGGEPVPIRPEPSLLPLLRAGQASRAYELAARRLQVSGLTPFVKTTVVPSPQPRRLAAALLFPIDYQDTRRLAELALIPPEEDQ
jgi:CRISPR-associated protein Csx17